MDKQTLHLVPLKTITFGLLIKVTLPSLLNNVYKTSILVILVMKHIFMLYAHLPHMAQV